MTRLSNPPKCHTEIPHPYTHFNNIYHDIITPFNTIHNKLYDHIYIHRNPCSRSIQNMQKTFPYLPKQLLIKALKCNEPIIKYTHRTPSTLNTPPQRPTMLTSQESYIMTWNASSLNTMSCLQDLATYSQTPPTTIIIQETKLTVTKFTKYI